MLSNKRFIERFFLLVHSYKFAFTPNKWRNHSLAHLLVFNTQFNQLSFIGSNNNFRMNLPFKTHLEGE